jgi:hypothetical protein
MISSSHSTTTLGRYYRQFDNGAGTYRSKGPELAFFERVSGFSVPQCKVIRQFLEYMRDVHGEEFSGRESEISIKRYWYRF